MQRGNGARMHGPFQWLGRLDRLPHAMVVLTLLLLPSSCAGHSDQLLKSPNLNRSEERPPVVHPSSRIQTTARECPYRPCSHLARRRSPLRPMSIIHRRIPGATPRASRGLVRTAVPRAAIQDCPVLWIASASFGNTKIWPSEMRFHLRSLLRGSTTTRLATIASSIMASGTEVSCVGDLAWHARGTRTLPAGRPIRRRVPRDNIRPCRTGTEPIWDPAL